MTPTQPATEHAPTLSATDSRHMQEPDRHLCDAWHYLPQTASADRRHRERVASALDVLDCAA